MRIAKNTEITLTECPSSRFLLVIDVMDGDVLLKKAEDTLIHIRLKGDDVHATLSYPDGRTKTLFGEAARGKEVILTSGYARMGLYVGGVLFDEDFFYTPLEYRDATVKAGSFMHFEAGYEYHSAGESAIVEGLTSTLDGYALEGYAHAVHRPLPTVIGERLHLLYLSGRTHAEAGKDKTAHKLCAMFSDDGEAFHGAPIALGIDNVRECDILDAALLKKDGRYYLYYIVEYASYRTLSCAVSEDGFSYQKTGLDVEIPYVKNADITSVSVADGPTPRLYFVADGNAFFAESIDLLRFAPPTPLALPTVDKVIPMQNGDVYAQREEKLYRVLDGVLTPVENAPHLAYPVFHHGALSFIGIRDGAFSYQKG
ncbi:MAG: hypothetical protein E7609_01545 [Ruminococcaceae bacterium]|nr:hypothetical protein [Oscillospiraceae bacterium]